MQVLFHFVYWLQCTYLSYNVHVCHFTVCILDDYWIWALLLKNMIFCLGLYSLYKPVSQSWSQSAQTLSPTRSGTPGRKLMFSSRKSVIHSLTISQTMFQHVSMLITPTPRELVPPLRPWVAWPGWNRKCLQRQAQRTDSACKGFKSLSSQLSSYSLGAIHYRVYYMFLWLNLWTDELL